jgi:hypothetical protein
MVNDPNGRPEVDLTLKSLHGIAWRSDEWITPEGDSEPPNVKATVAFTGSASNMQVSSSTMCSRTGHLVIESLSMNPDDARQTSSKERFNPLVAAFHVDAVEGNNSALSTPASASSVDSSLRPHLTLRLPSIDPKLPSVPVSEVNRNSRVVSSSQWAESNKNHSTMTDSTGKSWRQSVLWSPTPVMPEIIELNVTLRSEDNTVYQEGIAHLLFFQQGESGITTLDLPVKIKTGQAQSMVTLQPDAYIRVQIAIIKSADRAPSPTPTVTSSEWSQEMEFELKLSGMMDQRKEQEEMAAARAKTFPKQAAEIPKKRWPSRMICAALDVRQTVKEFGDAFGNCGAPKEYPYGFGDRGIKFCNSMMESTIATRESWGI